MSFLKPKEEYKITGQTFNSFNVRLKVFPESLPAMQEKGRQTEVV